MPTYLSHVEIPIFTQTKHNRYKTFRSDIKRTYALKAVKALISRRGNS